MKLKKLIFRLKIIFYWFLTERKQAVCLGNDNVKVEDNVKKEISKLKKELEPTQYKLPRGKYLP